MNFEVVSRCQGNLKFIVFLQLFGLFEPKQTSWKLRQRVIISIVIAHISIGQRWNDSICYLGYSRDKESSDRVMCIYLIQLPEKLLQVCQIIFLTYPYDISF